MGEHATLGTLQLRQLAELATGRDFSGAFNEDVLDGAPEIKMLSLDDINDALGTQHTACCVRAWGVVPIAWTEESTLVPGDGLPSVDEQRQAHIAAQAAFLEAHPEQEPVDEEQA